jgi:hypothetical protein
VKSEKRKEGRGKRKEEREKGRAVFEEMSVRRINP